PRITVVVPLTYVVSVLMLILATGTATSGVGIVILAPLIWTVLYHRRWESAVVVVGIVVVQVVTSLTPVLQSDSVIMRKVVFWALLGGLLSIAAHDLRERVHRHLTARDELLRQGAALTEAAEALTSILDPDAVVERAVRLAAELISPPGTPGRRAQYVRIEGDLARVVAEYDEFGERVAERFPLEQHPNLSYVYRTGRALSRRLDASGVGPAVRVIAERLGVSNGIYVPVIHEGEIDGVLSVSIRGGPVAPELFEHCKSIGHLLELALSNALAHVELREQATTDSMTGLLNRRGFDGFVANRPGRRPYALLALDVDGLKPVNDSSGHAAGDALLVNVARQASATLRRGDVLARVGGDEFVAYLFDAGEVDARIVAERILSGLAGADGEAAVGVSIGIATGGPNDDIVTVHAFADAAMYQAKRTGGRRYVTAASLALSGPLPG
ncbi:MAG: diguanylate cyclase, partial [Acidimicrobiales bacterium]